MTRQTAGWGLVAFALVSCDADKDRDPELRARRIQNCPDLDTWAACDKRLHEQMLVTIAKQEEAQRAEQAKLLATTERNADAVWAEYDARKKKDKAAFGEAWLRASDAVKPASAISQAPFERMMSEARLRMAPLIQKEAWAAGALHDSLVPSNDRAKCLVWGSMWTGNDVTFASLREIGFKSVECSPKIWNLIELSHTCFAYPVDGEREGAVLVWSTLDLWKVATAIGHESGDQALMTYLSLVSKGAKTMEAGREFEILDESAEWHHVRGRGPLADVTGYLERGACSRKKR